MDAVLLALLTAVSYGLANYLGPLLTRRHPLGGVLVVGQVAGLAGATVLLLATRGPAPDLRHLVLGLLAGIANAGALATLYAAAAAGPLSIVAPIGATGSVVPVVVSLVAGERPGLLQVVGIPLAVAGVALAAARDSSGSGLPGGGAPAQQASRRTVGLAVLSAAFFGCFLALFAVASEEGLAWGAFTSRASLVVCTAAVLVARGVPVRVPLDRVPALVVPGLLLLVGTVAYGEATTRGLVSVVAVLATLAPVVTVGLAVVLLGERLARRQRLGVATALVGVVLLAAG